MLSEPKNGHNCPESYSSRKKFHKLIIKDANEGFRNKESNTAILIKRVLYFYSGKDR
jgi:hypothetical protein